MNSMTKIKLDAIHTGAPKDWLKEEIKSVTYHQMEIVKIDNKFSTRVVFDI